jgi:UDP-glucose 4-epimerase
VSAFSRTPAPGSDTLLLPIAEASSAAFREAVRGLEAVVHCAAQNNDDPAGAQGLVSANVVLTERLAAAAAEEGVARFVYLSSIRAVADPGVDIAIGDDSVAAPTESYGRSKLGGEMVALAAARPGFLPLVLRLPPVYGEGMRGNLGLLLRLAGTRAPLPLAGLSGRRSLVSAEAVARAVATLLTISKPARSIYLASDPVPVTVPDIVAALRRGFGRRPGLFALPHTFLRAGAALAGRGDAWAGLAASQTCDPTSLIAAGWTPEPDSLAGLERLAARSGRA